MFLAYKDSVLPQGGAGGGTLSSWITEEEAVSFLLTVVLKVWSPQTADGL